MHRSILQAVIDVNSFVEANQFDFATTGYEPRGATEGESCASFGNPSLRSPRQDRGEWILGKVLFGEICVSLHLFQAANRALEGALQAPAPVE